MSAEAEGMCESSAVLFLAEVSICLILHLKRNLDEREIGDGISVRRNQKEENINKDKRVLCIHNFFKKNACKGMSKDTEKIIGFVISSRLVYDSAELNIFVDYATTRNVHFRMEMGKRMRRDMTQMKTRQHYHHWAAFWDNLRTNYWNHQQLTAKQPAIHYPKTLDLYPWVVAFLHTLLSLPFARYCWLSTEL